MRKRDTGILVLATLLTICTFIFCAQKFHEALNSDVGVKWESEPPIELGIGPAWFYYDNKNKMLMSSKPMTIADKNELILLYPRNKLIEPTYILAIDKLAYISNKEISNLFLPMLTLGIVGGLLGVMIRSLSSYIYHSCTQKDLNMKEWWPWYFLRPFIGMGLGLTIVVLTKTKLLSVGSQGEPTGFWVIGLCILAGFAAEEVSDRLYYMSKALFGGEEVIKNKTKHGETGSESNIL